MPGLRWPPALEEKVGGGLAGGGYKAARERRWPTGVDPSVRWLATEQEGHMEGCGARCAAGGRRGAAVRAAGRGGRMKEEEVSTVDGP